MKKTIISSAIILCIALAVVTCIIIKNSAKLPDPVKAESISQLVPTAGTAKPDGFSRHSYIKRDPPVDGYEKALTAVQITAMFSGNDILQLQEKGTKDLSGCRVLYYKDGSIHTIWLLDQEKSISFTIDPDCDPPGPVKYGIIPLGTVPVDVDGYIVYFIHQEAFGEYDLFIEKGRQTVWMVGKDRAAMAEFGDLIIKCGMDFSSITDN